MNEVEGAGSEPLPKNNGSGNNGSKPPAPTTTTPAPNATAPLVVNTSLNQALPPSVNVSPGQGTLSPASSGSATTTTTTTTTKQPASSPLSNTNDQHPPLPFDTNASPAIPTIPSNPSPSPSSSTTTTTSTKISRKKQKVKESIIDHTYRDFSSVKVSLEDGENENKNRPNFTAKLHGIVSNPNYQHIICWLPHGRSWKIVDKYLLTSVVIPQHFAHGKFESFNRSVNGWGFKRLLNPGPDCKSYYHECFLRGRPELTRLMQRLINPGKRLPDKSGEPDFYEISKNFPLPPSLPPVPSSMPSSMQPSIPPMMPPSMPPSIPAPVSSSGKSQARTKIPPPLGLPSPNAGRPGQPPQPVAFASPPHHMNGYNMYGQYGYPQAALPHPAMPSQGPMLSQGPMPSPGGAANQGPNHHPHQPPPPHQMYWPGQVAGSPPYQPTPPYGYYPYPPQLAMMGPRGGQQQGYYMVQQPPYPPPGMHNPYFHPTHAAVATPQASGPPMDASEWMKQAERAARSDAGLDSATNPGEAGQDLNLAGLAAVSEVASVNGDNAGESEEAKSDEQADSNAELTTEV